MLSILIAAVIGMAVGAYTWIDLSPAWGVTCGLLVFLLGNTVSMLLLRRKINQVQQKLQEVMVAGQARLNRQVQLFQQRPSGNMKMMQTKLETMQDEVLHESLRATALYEPYYRWNWMLPKQVNSMKMQLYFQLRQYDKVDQLLPKCFLLDVRSVSIKMVRMYKNQDPKLDKFYAKKRRRFKADEAALLACTYAWIKLKQEDSAKALEALVEARKRSDNQTMIANYEAIANGKLKHFSNANFGESWYALYLEEPKVKQQRAQQQRMY